MTDFDYGVAGNICSELLDEIGVSSGASVLDVVKNALNLNPYGTEVNGDLVKEVTHDGLIYTSGSPKNKHYLLPEDVDWLRVEHYAKDTNTHGPCIMYVYIHKNPNSDEFEMDNVEFDYYPDPETEDYVDGVQYRDCVQYMGMTESAKRNNKMKCKECGTMKKINEEIDIGWDLAARRDSDIQHSRARDEQEKWEKSTEITLNGRKTSVSNAKRRVKNLMGWLDGDDPAMDIGADLLRKLKNASPGDSFEYYEFEKHCRDRENAYYHKVVKESSKPPMWAIDYRDMNSAIHGLYYAKDRKLVEEFYEALKFVLDKRNPEYADDPELREMDYQNLWDEFYSRGIKQIEEINFRDIGKLPSGKYGIIIDDVEYRIVNVMDCLDVYEESKKVVNESYDDDWTSVWAAFGEFVQRLWRYTRKDRDSRMAAYKDCIKACEKATKDYHDTVVPSGESAEVPVCESTSYSGDPRIYVGTYAKYNDGSLDGKWIDLTAFDTYDEFVDYCRELHKDEKDPEFMVQDFENYPKAWYHESGLPSKEEFDKIVEFSMMDDDRRAAYEAYVNHTGDDDFEHFQEAYQGKFDSASDFAYHLVDDFGLDGIGEENLTMYFDYDQFGRDLMFDFHLGDPDNTDADGNPEDQDKYYDNNGYEMGEYESDRQVAEDYIEDIGGVSQLGNDTMQTYFDYEAFGLDLLTTDYFEEDGYVFLYI